jgi:predicted Zn-dependent protease with MMP-like domain
MIHLPAEFVRAVEQALAAVAEFQPTCKTSRSRCGRPDAAFQREHDVPDDILGLYVGVPLEEKGPELAPTALPDRILIFRENLCGMCTSRDELVDEIRITVLHEIGHHFGLDEDRLAELGYD